ncbi:MAG: aldolase/citrate lyase family protein [Candidatus Omnitrophota bacterium]|nr:aldolase/citrate lyase family protein [Candidatus Omnitrophota bacterium]
MEKRRLVLRTKLRSRKLVFAAWTSLYHPSITEIFSHSGVDFVGIDIEHSTISQEQSQRIIATAQASDSLCLPRVASHNMEMIKRLLDSGADGIIVPMVNTAREAREIASWCKYPPQGKRSFGISRGQGYGFDFDRYTKKWNSVSSLIVQIESITGVENIEDILGIDAVDAAMVGPYDLSGSLNIPGKIDHPKIREAAKRVIAACRKAGKACGTQIIDPDARQIKNALDQGFTFIVLSSDVFLLWKWAQRMRGYTRMNRK